MPGRVAARVGPAPVPPRPAPVGARRVLAGARRAGAEW